MSRLKKLADRPRENRRKVTYLLKIGLEVDNGDGDAIDSLKLFKNWVGDKFTQWDRSILEYFLYDYGLVQSADDDKYFLDFRIEKILEDDTNDTDYNIDSNIKDDTDENKDENKKD